MALSQKGYEALKKTELRMKIALALGVSEQAIIQAIRRKSDLLTKYSILQIIKAETGLQESEIVEEIKIPS